MPNQPSHMPQKRMRFLSTLVASTLGALLAFGLVFFIALFFFVALAASTEQAPRVRAGSVLVVPLAGSIQERSSDDPLAASLLGERSYNLMQFKEALQKATVDPRVDGIWLQLKGLSTSWATLQEIRSALVAFKESGKFIVASSDDHAVGEGSYFLASAADEIYSSAQAPFEFNGFYMAGEFYKNMLDKLDIEAQPVRAGKYKSAIEPFTRTNLSDANREQLSALLDAQYNTFLETIANSRDLSRDNILAAMETEAILTATDAYRVGLIDDLLFHDQVKTLIKSKMALEETDELRTISLRSYTRVPKSDAGIETSRKNEIAIVYAVGAIMTGTSGYSANPLLGGEIVGSETFNEAIRDAVESDRVKAIVVRVSSPGGSAAASDAMWREIKLAAEQKPVIISMGNVAASGGYWIATAGDMIIANPLTITGSIGVFSMMLDTSGLFENKIGINFDVVRTGPFADMYSGTRALSPEEIRLLSQSTEETYQSFLELVAESRGMSVEEVHALAQGRVWSGVDALEAGLVDELGGLDLALERAAEQADIQEGGYSIKILPRPKTFIEQMNEALNARAAQVWLNLTLSPTEQLLRQEAEKLKVFNQLHGTVQAWMPGKLEVR